MVFSNNLLLGAGAQSTGPTPFNPTVIGNSVWLDGSADTLTKTFSSGSPQTKIVISTWIQRNRFATRSDIFSAAGGTGGASRNNTIQLQTDGTLNIGIETSTSKTIIYSTVKVFRDIGWYHILVSIDQGAALGTPQVNLFVNGVPVTISATDDIDQGFTAALSGWGNAGALHSIGSRNFGTISLPYKGYQAQTTMLVGQSIQSGDVAVTDFLDIFAYGTNGSQFAPKADADIAALASTAGGNSFCLDYGNSSSLGLDISSLGNNFTPVSMSSVNQSTNTPSLTYLQLNPLNKFGTANLSEGNTRVSVGDSDSIRGTKYITSGKHYLEVTVNTVNNTYIGVANNSKNPLGFAKEGAACLQKGGDIYVNNTALVGGTFAKAFTDGDVVGVLIDVDARKFWQSLNGTFNSCDRTPAITLSAEQVLAGTGGFDLTSVPGDSGVYTLHIGNSTGTSADVSVNGGHKAFSHTPPTGYLDWGSDNYTTPEFQGKDFFDTTLYEGNGTGQRVGDFVPFTDAYAVDKSAMFDSGDLRFLARTPSSGGNEKTLTFSTWIKMTGIGNSNENAVLSTNPGSEEAQIRITGNTLATKKVQANLFNGSSFVLNIKTDRTFGDTSSWNHVVVAYDTRAAVASANKVIIYINGVRQSVSGTDLATNDYDTGFNSTTVHNIGRQVNNAVGEPDFYLAETVMIDGQQLDPTSFGQLDTATNRWIPKDVSGLTFGTNGFYLEYESTFASGSGAGTDTSGNSNNWTESTDGGTAWATTDQFIDTPTKNFAVLDPNNNQGNTISEGGTKLSPGSASWQSTAATIKGLTSGKFYFEFTPETTGSNISLGIGSPPFSTTVDTLLGQNIHEYGYYFANGNRYNNSVFTSYGSTVAAGDVVGVAIDLDNNRIFFARNNTFENSGNPVTGVNAAFSIANNVSYDVVISMTASVTTANNTINFGGQSALAFTPPEGFLELNQDNLDDTQSKITAFAWIKNRDATDNHMLFDRIRGVGNDLHSNATAVQTFNANTVQRFLQRGVQVGSDVEVNTVNESYVLWQWLLGDSATTGTAISADNPPTIASTNLVADSGAFGMCTYTGNATAGATVQHSLGGVPDMIMFKRFGATTANWVVYFKELGAGNSDYLMLDLTLAEGGAGAIAWLNSTAATSTLVTLGSDCNVNASDTYIMYLFRNVPGVCKVGSYIGNGNNNGPYVSVGFSPRYILVRSTSANRNWNTLDTARNPINIASPSVLLPNSTAVDTAGQVGAFDILADGFKPRDTASNTNGSGEKYMYLAMADIGGNGTLPPIYGK